MDSVRVDSIVRFAELKPGRERFQARMSPSPNADAKPIGATPGAIVDEDADQDLTFESAPERSTRFHCGETFENKRLRDVLWAGQEPIEVVIVDSDVETRFFLKRI